MTVHVGTADDRRVAAARKWARHYRSLGYQALPSRPDAKRPMCRFADWWEGGGPDPDRLWDQFPTSNIQLICGRHHRLAVIDLDGPESIAAWSTFGPVPWTWVSSSGGGGRHVWFTIPGGLAGPLPKRRLWGLWDRESNGGKGAWEKRKAIEFLGDRSLVMAPPSVHPETGRVYRFHAGCSPREMARPAPIPAWVLDLPTADPPRPAFVPAPAPTPSRKAPRGPLPAGVMRRDVMAAIPDKLALARSWGLRVASGRATASGWISCHDFDREDRHPSARFHPETGRFWRPGARPISLFDLAVERGYYGDWRECRDDLASTYLLRDHHAGSSYRR